MSRKNRKGVAATPVTQNSIRVGEQSSQAKITFSFELYPDNGEFCLSTWTKEQIKDAMHDLKEFCKEPLSKQKGGTYWRCHTVDWNRTKKRHGFRSQEANDMGSAWQFAMPSVSGFHKGKKSVARVFGAFSGSTFYIIWFDLTHEIYGGK